MGSGQAAQEAVLIRDAAAEPRAGAGAGASGRPHLMLLDAVALSGFDAEWRDLAANAAEKNPFFAPWQLGPAFAHLSENGVRIACVFDGPGGALIGLAPMAFRRGYARLPFLYGAAWIHEHCFFGAPLLRAGRELAAMQGLLQLTEQRGRRPAFLRFTRLAAGGPVAAAAIAAAAQEGRIAYETGGYFRAVLTGGYEAEAFLADSIRKKKRKEMGRLRRRLEEDGAVTFEALQNAAELDAWCEDFLALEASGWKGGKGSALASKPAHEEFFRETVRGALEEGALDFFKLSLGGKPLAMIVNFISEGEGYSFKIAHDESYARYSPGVMLEVEMTRALESRAGLKFVDSCAARDHPMINSLWRDRRQITQINISGASLPQRLSLRLARALETASAGIKAARAPENGA